MAARCTPEHNRGALIAVGDLPADLTAAQCLAPLLGLAGLRPRVLLLHSAAAHEQARADADEHLYTALRAAGAGEVAQPMLRSRSEAGEPALLDALDRAEVLVLACDRPLRLSTLIGGTPLARAIRRRNAEGAPVIGCGAAAAVLCEHMLAQGDTAGSTPRSGGAQLAPGIGLTNRLIIDRGGHASDRIGRLLAALALNPCVLGLGIDAATAAVIGADNVLEVVGDGGVTLIDPAEMTDCNVLDLQPGAPIRITNLRLHAMADGARYDLDFRCTVD